MLRLGFCVKGFSANFAFTEFSEGRIAPILYGRRSEGRTEALGVGRSSATECREGCTVGLWPTKKIPAAGGAPVGSFGRDGSGPQRGPPPSGLPLSARPPTDRAMWRRLL